LKIDIVIHVELQNTTIGAPFNMFATIGDWFYKLISLFPFGGPKGACHIQRD
jgi:hypothetical protein